MFIYFFSATISYSFMFIYRKFKNINTVIAMFFFLLSFFVIWLLSAMRFGVGTDFFSYYNYLGNLEYIKEKLNLYEYGMWILANITKYFSMDGQVFISITSFVILALIFLTLKKNVSYPEISILFFLGLGFYFTSLNIVRQYIAISLVFYATFYLLKNRKRYFYMFVAVAASFHTTALIALTFVFFHKYKNDSLKIYIFIFLTLIFITLFYEQFMGIVLIGDYSEYASTRYISEGASYIFLMIYFCIALLFYIFRKNLINDNGDNKFYLLITFVGLCLIFIGTKSLIVVRLSEYFTIFNIILFSELIRSFKNIYLKNVIYLTLVVVAYVSIYVFLSRNLGGVLPYRAF